MRLEEIVDALEIAQNTTIPLDESQNGVLVNGLSYDSRNTKIGDLFFCVSGNTQDGHDFASHAVENGASVLVVERNLELQTPQVKVSDVRSAMAEISEIFFNFPSKELVTAGITGTNGKTTTVNLLADIAASADQNSATIGTLTGTRTTPEAPDLQRQIRELVDAGKSFLSMEVSSHALSQRRISNIKYDVAVFTNLSLDHLDFHGDMETYFQAKALLFTPAHAKYAVINVDSPYGQRLAEGIEIPHRTISMDEIEILHESIRASVFIWEGEKIELQIPGTFNMENALAAAVTAQVLVGKITSFNESEDGRYLIILNGLSRFKIIDEINNNKLYRECNVSFNEFKNDIDSKKEEIKFTDLELIFKDLKNLFQKKGYIINWKELEKQDLKQTINTLAMASPFSLEEKQALLETQNLISRKFKLEEIINTYVSDDFNNTTIQ